MQGSSEVLIIGAGVAGLAAAGKLSEAGVRALVLEARNRIGGRVLTVHPPGLQTAVELGAEFIHGRAPEIFDVIKSAGLDARKIEGEPFCSNKHALGRCDFWGRIEKVLETMKKEATPRQSFAAFVNQLDDDEISEEDKRAACNYVRGFHAAHPDEISVQSIIEGMEAEEKIDGDSQFRLPQGYDHIVDALSCKLQPESARVQLNTSVKAVRWKSGSAEVHAADAEGRPTQFQSQKLLVTLPLGLLIASGPENVPVRFDPPLTMKSTALAKLRVGHVIRVSIVFRRRFWAEMKVDGRSLAKMTFLFSQDRVFPTWWTFAPTEAPLLTAWAPADAAERLSQLSNSEICEEAGQALARVFHMPVPWCREEIVQAYTHNWQKDPYSRGAYSYIAEGGGDTIREFAAPLESTLFFAGEATNFVGHHATVHGAIASGYRAAQEILKTI